ncbi:MAG: ATP-dependent RecD-like DNA helicase [Candidatus Hydrogenedentota bacterium]
MAPHTTPSQEDFQPIVTIEGVVERIVFESEETGFFVARLQESGKHDLTTFVGNLMAISPGETVRLKGRWVDDQRFGRQLRVTNYETIQPNTVVGIEKYLGSGLIEGIGPHFAKRLVKAFGVQTLRVIDEEPRKLTRVPGIGKKRAAQIREAWQKQRALQSIMLFLQGHGISPAQAVKIYKRYGDGAVTVLRENPYRLAEDVAGMAFKSADKIAANLGIEKESPVRVQAGLTHVLHNAAGNGNVCLPVSELFPDAAEMLGVSEELLKPALAAQVAEGKLVQEGDWVYTKALYAAECGVAERLKRLMTMPAESLGITNMENALRFAAQKQRIDLSEEQQQAVRTALEHKVLVITGGPGTGKTTVIRSILAILSKKNVTCYLAAPTGRAAKRMEEATGRQARTIHRLLEFSPQEGGFTKNEYDPLRAEVLVVDEASMIDIALMHALLKALPPQARLILVGDVDQLPSVGPGNVLMDIIASSAAPVVRLQVVFRQAAESGIISNAHRINTGQHPAFNETDFFFIERDDPVEARETIIEVVQKRLPRSFHLDPLKDVQVLAPMHRGDAGVSQLNESLQQALNPNGRPISRKGFRVGDKVMQLRNNYELEVYNGDVGMITAVNEEERAVTVDYEGRAVGYTFDNLDELTLAYAATIHKSQGSEYQAVVLTLLPQHYMMLQRNVLYTGITRAKRIAVIVGTQRAVAMAVRNSRTTRRHTRLTERLRNEL